MVKNPPASAGRCKRHRFDPWVGKIPWRRAQQPTPVFLPGESHGRGAWWAAVHRVTCSRTLMKQFSMHTHMHRLKNLTRTGLRLGQTPRESSPKVQAKCSSHCPSCHIRNPQGTKLDLFRPQQRGGPTPTSTLQDGSKSLSPLSCSGH